MLFGISFTTGVPGGGAAPSLSIAQTAEEFAASSLMTSDAVALASAYRQNVTDMLQLDPAGYAPEHPLFT